MAGRAPSPLRNPERLTTLYSTGLLDTYEDERLDRLTRLAAQTLRAPIAAITVLDDRRQYFVSAVGLREPFRSRHEVPLSHSYCKYVVTSDRPLKVEDARRHRWLRKSPAIEELGMVAYLGVPLRAPSGHSLGSFFLADSVPRLWTVEERRALEDFTRIAADHIALRLSRPHDPPAQDGSGPVRTVLGEPLPPTAGFHLLVEQSIVGIGIVQNDRIRYANPVLAQIFGYSEKELLALPSACELVVEEDRGQVARSLGRRSESAAQSFRCLFRGRRKDGEVIHIEVYGSHAQFDGASAVVGVLLDATERERAKAAHRASEERFRRLFEDDLTGNLIITPEGKIIACNPAFVRMFGYGSVDEVLSADAGRFFAVGDPPRAWLERLRAEGRFELLESELLRKDGQPIHVLENAVGIRDEEGKITEVRRYLFDISKRKKAEEALRRNEERFRLVARATNDVLWEWDIATGHVYWGEAAPNVFRYAPAEVGPTIEWWVDQIHPDDRERVVSDLHHIVHGVGDVWTSEYRFLRGDGVYATLLDRGYVVREEAGAPSRTIGSMMDVTERRRSEESHRLLARVSALLESSLDPTTTLPTVARAVIPVLADYCLIDLIEGGHLRRGTEAHAVPAKEALLRTLQSPPPTAVGGPDLHSKIMMEREPILIPDATTSLIEAHETGPDHGYRQAALATRSLMIIPLVMREEVLGVLTLASSESGRHYGPMDVLVAQDLGRRLALALENARLYRSAQQAVRDREQVLGVVSHDLRNPLNTIKLSVDLLRNLGEERRSNNVRWMDVIGRSADQMERMIEDLLDLSNIDAGGFTVSPADHDVATLLGEVCDSFEPLAAQKSIALRCDPGAGDFTAWVDSHRIRRVFSNLLGNALKFTPQGGTITVRAENLQPEIRFSVSDTGSGIPAEQIPYVFDRFWQGRKGDRRGAGLGLSIARGIVEAHGGRLWVQSTPGEGSTFFFTVAPTPAGSPEPVPASQTRAAALVP